MTLRIGVALVEGDYVWIQIREAIFQHARELGVEIVLIHGNDFLPSSSEATAAWVDELQALHLDSLITVFVGESLLPLLEQGMPVVALTETSLRHPRFVSPSGFFELAYQLGCYLGDQMAGTGTALIVGGLQDPGEAGRSRLAGLRAGLATHPLIAIRHLPSFWGYEDAYREVGKLLALEQRPFDGIVGITDALALATRDRCQMAGLLNDRTAVGGIYGDPLALAAISQGQMTATMALKITDFAETALALAIRGARQQALTMSFCYPASLVTALNIHEWIKPPVDYHLPAYRLTRHLALSHQHEQRQQIQLETSLAITYRIGTILDPQQLIYEIADVIRANYGYDLVQLFRWDADKQVFIQQQPETTETPGATNCIPFAASGVLGQVLLRGDAITLDDALHRIPIPTRPQWPGTRTRYLVPVRLGTTIQGILDLHSKQELAHSWQDVIGLQALANQLGVAIRSAELYQVAVAARKHAELLNQLKTSLLANVSHELRTPLQIILAYTQAGLESSTRYGFDLPPELLRDLHHIQGSDEHLIHLIDDLLDITRAEIGELKLTRQQISTHAFLEGVFHHLADSNQQEAVTWHLDLAANLPALTADPVRLRQILFNLLTNAHKWTTHGQIVLGAAVEAPWLHLWIRDTGCGISQDRQTHIFEPFVTSDHLERAHSAGLGLAITRRLVELHGGKLLLESTPGIGSTFHIYLPLSTPALSTNQPRTQRGDRMSLSPEACTGTTPDASDDSRSVKDNRSIKYSNLTKKHPTVQLSPPNSSQLIMKPVQYHDLAQLLTNMARPATSSKSPVLIIEDDQETRELYHQLVARTLPDLPILTAASGEAALVLLGQETPALLILDLQMPGIDGFTVLEHLRATPGTYHVPVLVLSGRLLTLEDIQRLNQARVILYTKDILTSDEIKKSVQRMLADDQVLAPQTSLLVKQAQFYLQQAYTHKVTLQELAHAIGTSRSYLSRIFQQELKLSPWEYLNRYRIMKARHLLHQSSQPISEIAMAVGFQDVSYFNRLFRLQTGHSPRMYRTMLIHQKPLTKKG